MKQVELRDEMTGYPALPWGSQEGSPRWGALQGKNENMKTLI